MSAELWIDKGEGEGEGEDYFCETYGCPGLNRRLGFSWWNDICPIVEKTDRKLVGEDLISFRNLIRDTPMTWVTKDNLGKYDDDYDIDTEDDKVAWEKRRQKLVAFLSRAIDANKPVYCSL